MHLFGCSKGSYGMKYNSTERQEQKRIHSQVFFREYCSIPEQFVHVKNLFTIAATIYSCHHLHCLKKLQCNENFVN